MKKKTKLERINAIIKDFKKSKKASKSIFENLEAIKALEECLDALEKEYLEDGVIQ